MAMNTYLLRLGAVLTGLCAFPALAVEPPKGDETLCGVTGQVLTILSEEMQMAGQSQHVMVPVVVMEVTEAAPVDAQYKGGFCQRITTVPAGGKPTGYYRLCDATAEFMTGQRIHGVVGLSKGGGRYCLAEIKILP
jgi:hypothetical protein